MATEILNLSELRGLSKDEALAKAKAFAADRHNLNGELAGLDHEIQRYETRYEFPSAELNVRLANGLVKDTFDICRWAMILQARDSLVASSK